MGPAKPPPISYPSAPAGPPRRARRTLLGIAAAAVGISAVALCAGAGFVGWIGTRAGSLWLEGQLETRISALTQGGKLELGGLRVGREGLQLDGVVLSDAAGRPLISLDRVVSDLSPWSLLDRTLRLDRTRVDGAMIDLGADETGTLDLVRLFGGPSAAGGDPFELPLALELPLVEVSGLNLRYATPSGTAVELVGVEGQLSLDGRGHALAFSRVRAAGQLAVPGPIPVRASGDLRYDFAEGLKLDGVDLIVPHGRASVVGQLGTDVDLRVRVDQIEARTLDPLAGDVGLGGTWAGSLAARSEGPRIALTGGLYGIERSAGAITLSGTLDRSATPVAYAATAELAELHVEQLYTPIEAPVVVSGIVDLSGKGVRLDEIDASGRWRGGGQILYGQPVDRLDARFSVRDGVLALAQTELDGLVGALVLDGEIDLVDGPLHIEARGPLSPDRLAKLGVDGLDGRGTIEATLRGDWKPDPGADPDAGIPIDIDGTVRYAPFVYAETARADALSAPFSARAHRGTVTGRVGLRGTGVEALGLAADTLQTDDLRFVSHSGQTTVTGPLSIGHVAYGPWARVDAVAVDLHFGSSSDRGATHRSIDASVALTDYTLADRPGTDGTARIAVRDDFVRFGAALDDLGRRVLGVTGSYDTASAELALDALSFAPTPRTTWTSRAPARMQLVSGGVRGVELALDSDLGTVELSGDLGTEGALDGSVRIASLQLDHLAELYPERLGSAGGTLDAQIALRGDALAPEIDADLDLRGLYLDETVRWLDVKGDVRIAGGEARPDLRLGVAGVDLGALTGRLPLSGGLAEPAVDLDAETDLVLALAPGAIDRLATLSPSLADSSVPSGRFSAVLEASGRLRDPLLRLAGVSELDVPGWTRAGRVEFDLSSQAGALLVNADLREGLSTRATVAGSGRTRINDLVRYALEGAQPPAFDDPTLYLDEMDIATALVGVPAASLGALSGLDASLSGELVGGLTITGSPSRPVLDGAVHWLDPRIGSTSVDGAYLALVPTPSTEGAPGAGYHLDLSVAFPSDGAVEVHGEVPVAVDLTRPVEAWPSGDLALDVSGRAIPLSLLTALDPSLRDGSGIVSIEGRVGGTALRPSPDLVATVSDGRLTYRDLGITASEIGVKLAMQGDTLKLDHADFVLEPSDRFSAGGFGVAAISETERPQVHVSGQTRLDGHMPSELAAEILLDNGPWLAATPRTTLRANGAITVGGTWPHLSVDGALDVVHGRINLDSSVLEGDTPLRIDPALTIHRSTQPPASSIPEEPPLYADFDVDVDVDLKRNLELSMSMPFVDDLGEVGAQLSRADIATRLGGEVAVEMRDGQPTLVGAVEVVEGKVRLLRSNLALDNGSITFAGGDPYEDASLDLDAQMVVSGGSLDLAISGTPTEPTFQPHSEAYPDPAAQWTILLTGQSPEELSSDQAQGAAQALAGVFLNSLLSGRSLGTLSIEPDGSVRLGVPITPSIYAASQLTPTSDPSRNALSLELEWSLARRIVASGGIGDQVQWGDLFWEIRF